MEPRTTAGRTAPSEEEAACDGPEESVWSQLTSLKRAQVQLYRARMTVLLTRLPRPKALGR